MTELLRQTAEERFGIKPDPDDLEKLRHYLGNTYGESPQGFPAIVEKAFSSGEAAHFLTVNETYFFREPAHFAFLRDILPSFEAGLQILSAATATGCEAYSIAMLLEAYNKVAESPIFYHIDAFDVNPKVIETANRGVYNERALREDGSAFRYMTEPYLKKTENGYQVAESLKRNISFFVHNLMDDIPQKDYDLVFFRNAFIYFSPKNRERILSNLAGALKKDGLLFVGVSETAGVQHAVLDGKNRNDVYYFQKTTKGLSNSEFGYKIGFTI
jgi:chemotaxis protein methyltransferase CheR